MLGTFRNTLYICSVEKTICITLNCMRMKKKNAKKGGKSFMSHEGQDTS